MNASPMRTAAACALLATTCFAVPLPAFAETKLINTPAEKFVIAPGGVDLRTGRYVYSETDLAIGAQGQSGGLALTRTMSNYVSGHLNPFANFSHNWDIMLIEARVDIFSGKPVGNDYRMNVHLGGRSQTFESRRNDIGYAYKGDGPATFLTFIGDRASAGVVYTLSASDGMIVKFRPMGSADCTDQVGNVVPRRCAFVSEMIEPDGTTFSFDYAYDGSRTGNRARLRQVTSSRGYALVLEGSGSLVSKACVLNLAQSAPPADGRCPQGALAAATYDYEAGGTTRLSSVTDPTGGVARFTYGPSGMGFVKAGQSVAWLTNVITIRPDEEDAPQETIDNQAFADGQSYAYNYGFTPFANNKPQRTIAGGSYTDAAGRSGAVVYDFPILPGTGPTTPCTRSPCAPQETGDEDNSTYQQTPGPVSITDSLGRTTESDYCDPAAMGGLPPTQQERCFVLPLRFFIDPEGIKTMLEYDGNRNITRVTRHPKPGQEALGTIVTSASYACINAKSCTKPTSMTDAKGNTTEYTYAPEHGGVLTETGPAVNGLRPQKRYSYAQRYAWTRNASGGLVQAVAPVWVLTQESSCKTGNASGSGCAVAGDEVVTTYEYGADAGPNNLQLRGVVTDAGSGRLNLRTCYAYDALGNKISETSPRAGLSSCQ